MSSIINKKTLLCKYYINNEICPFQEKCTFAHGENELLQNTTKTPCWFYNNGGCIKSDKDCIYEHVININIRKPLHLQHPCIEYHYITPKYCKYGNRCRGDHFYELTKEEWLYHFPTLQYPGKSYLKTNISTLYNIIPDNKHSTDLPYIGGKWSKPVSLTKNQPVYSNSKQINKYVIKNIINNILLPPINN